MTRKQRPAPAGPGGGAALGQDLRQVYPRAARAVVAVAVAICEHQQFLLDPDQLAALRARDPFAALRRGLHGERVLLLDAAAAGEVRP